MILWFVLQRQGGEVLGSAGKIEMGVVAWFGPVEKIRFSVFFRGCPKIFSLKIVLCKFSPPLLSYG
jgi:hypothetical protein